MHNSQNHNSNTENFRIPRTVVYLNTARDQKSMQLRKALGSKSKVTTWAAQLL